ncbi:hypothetical protein EVAR_7143_1 [Eumeta japonica]|uniref:Uncharacterized protein n=1 Tax=Eumeta variegata TaxID=151549 RepID=A0A4C1U6Q4_EUMVA|nr:hypothetical protein EVAR_7143_1 [Eumeta japonica]
MPEARKRFLRSCTPLTLSLSSRLCLTTVTTQYAFITHPRAPALSDLCLRLIKGRASSSRAAARVPFSAFPVSTPTTMMPRVEAVTSGSHWIRQRAR